MLAAGKIKLDVLLERVLLVNLGVGRVDVVAELFPRLAQLFELVLQLVNTLACTLVMLGDTDGLLCLFHKLLLLGFDLGGIVLVA